ncbi:MAG TPA: DUF4251 domain-containing protein [Hanamia sp.]
MKPNTIQKWTGIAFPAMLVALIFTACSSTHHAGKPTAGDIKDMVDSSQFVFVADRMTPMRGGSKTLTSYYAVTLMKDSINCYLPYVGRATQAPMNMTGGGIELISSKFSYDVVNKKEDQWEITIKPNETRDVQQLFFSIFSNGSANLNVTSTNRDPISFSGHLEKLK